MDIFEIAMASHCGSSDPWLQCVRELDLRIKERRTRPDAQFILDPSVAPTLLLREASVSLNRGAWLAVAREQFARGYGEAVGTFELALQSSDGPDRWVCAAPPELIAAIRTLRGSVRRLSVVSAVTLAQGVASSARLPARAGWYAMTTRKTFVLWREGLRADVCPPRPFPESRDLTAALRMESVLHEGLPAVGLQACIDLRLNAVADAIRPTPVCWIRPLDPLPSTGGGRFACVPCNATA